MSGAGGASLGRSPAPHASDAPPPLQALGSEAVRGSHHTSVFHRGGGGVCARGLRGASCATKPAVSSAPRPLFTSPPRCSHTGGLRPTLSSSSGAGRPFWVSMADGGPPPRRPIAQAAPPPSLPPSDARLGALGRRSATQRGRLGILLLAVAACTLAALAASGPTGGGRSVTWLRRGNLLVTPATCCDAGGCSAHLLYCLIWHTPAATALPLRAPLLGAAQTTRSRCRTPARCLPTSPGCGSGSRRWERGAHAWCSTTCTNRAAQACEAAARLPPRLPVGGTCACNPLAPHGLSASPTRPPTGALPCVPPASAC